MSAITSKCVSTAYGGLLAYADFDDGIRVVVSTSYHQPLDQFDYITFGIQADGKRERWAIDIEQAIFLRDMLTRSLRVRRKSCSVV